MEACVVKEGFRRRVQLMDLSEGSISIDDVAIMFRVSVPTVRKYLDIGLIWNSDREHGRLVFDLVVVRACYERWKRHRGNMTLKQMAHSMQGWVREDIARS